MHTTARRVARIAATVAFSAVAWAGISAGEAQATTVSPPSPRTVQPPHVDTVIPRIVAPVVP